MTYWLDLFTGITWQEFQDSGGNVTGFREHNWKRSEGIKKGDIFLCYMVGVSRWVGLLEVAGPRYREESKIWSEETFPVRFSVKPIVMLKPENGVPMKSLKGKLSFFVDGDESTKWSGAVRSSPTKYSLEDGDVIAAAIREAGESPISRPVDPKKLKRSANLYKTKLKQGGEEIDTVVSVPVDDDEEDEEVLPDFHSTETEEQAPTHTEIQWRLLDLGSKMGFKVWAPRNDRGRTFNGQTVSSVERILSSLPTNFDDVTNAIVENIDVIWLSEENAIAAAFEVEHTTAIYSGLLRMSDLLTMQPNIEIKLYIVGPDDRFTKFRKELPRPTFAYRRKPLHKVCRFLPYSQLCTRLDALNSVIRHLKPEFLDDIAKSYDPSKEEDA
jgi:hypothetical protein